jgi:GNAT superfamily N-acetyltransferase
MTTAAARYLAEFRTSLGFERLDEAATHVLVEEDRTGSNLIVGYLVEAATVVRAAPEHADLVQPLASPDRSLDFDDLRSWAESIGWVEFDGGRSHVADPGDIAEAAVPDGLRAVVLAANGADNERVLEWLRSADPNDVDEADFDLDELDDRMVALVDESDEIMALASSYPWEMAEMFEDIGVIVSSAARGKGAGRAVVRQLLDHLHADGQLGLYRCNWSNATSRRLALGLGFHQITDLIALCPKDDPKAAHLNETSE